MYGDTKLLPEERQFRMFPSKVSTSSFGSFTPGEFLPQVDQSFLVLMKKMCIVTISSKRDNGRGEIRYSLPNVSESAGGNPTGSSAGRRTDGN